MRKIRIIKIIFIILLCILLIIFINLLISWKLLSVSRYDYSNNKLHHEITIVQLSDLHNSQFGKDNCRLLEKIEQESPDVIFMTGDMLNSYEQRTDIVTDLIRNVSRIAPVYYSMGNFISTQDEYPRLIGGMAQISVELQGEGDGAELSITDYTLEPLFTQYNHNTGVYTVYKFSDYTDELALQNAMNGKNGVTLSRQVIWDEFTEIMKTSIEQPGAVLVEQPWLDADISLPDVGQSIGALVGGGKDRNSSAEGGSDQTGTADTSGSSDQTGISDTAGVPDGITTSDETESINETEY